jgi:S1-C subfamily serine protease
MNTWTSLSQDISAAVEKAAPSIVQVHGRRRVAAGVVIADGVIATPAATNEDTIAVMVDGQTLEGAVQGRTPGSGLTIVRVDQLKRPALAAAAEPAPGALAVAIGRTWSGGVMASLAPVSVVGGPLRTGRNSSIERVIRIQQAPHGALNGGALIDGDGKLLGIVTQFAIRGTTVVIPSAIVTDEATRVQRDGGSQQGFLGISSLAVPIPERQRAGRPQSAGLLISQVAPGSPADQAGLLVGDVVITFDGQPIQDAEDLLTRLRGNRIGSAVPLSVVRGLSVVDVSVTVAERPRLRG